MWTAAAATIGFGVLSAFMDDLLFGVLMLLSSLVFGGVCIYKRLP
jgi:hypothetical protein